MSLFFLVRSIYAPCGNRTLQWKIQPMLPRGFPLPRLSTLIASHPQVRVKHRDLAGQNAKQMSKHWESDYVSQQICSLVTVRIRTHIFTTTMELAQLECSPKNYHGGPTSPQNRVAKNFEPKQGQKTAR